MAIVMVNLAELEVWDGNVDAARAAIDRAVIATGRTDRPIALADTIVIGLRCEADAAEDARARGRADDEAHAIARGTQLHQQTDQLLARPGPRNGWKRDVRALAVLGHGEHARVRGVSDPSAWSAAVAALRDRSLAYLEAYARFRHAESVMGDSGERDAAAEHLIAAHRMAVGMGATPLRELIERSRAVPGSTSGPPAPRTARSG